MMFTATTATISIKAISSRSMGLILPGCPGKPSVRSAPVRGQLRLALKTTSSGTIRSGGTS